MNIGAIGSSFDLLSVYLNRFGTPERRLLGSIVPMMVSFPKMMMTEERMIIITAESTLRISILKASRPLQSNFRREMLMLVIKPQ